MLTATIPGAAYHSTTRSLQMSRILPRRSPADWSRPGFRRFYAVVDRAEDVQHALMLRVLFYTGFRVSELCGMLVADVDLECCKIRFNQGKGSKDRYVLFGKSFSTVLRNLETKYQARMK
jgi:integrase